MADLTFFSAASFEPIMKCDNAAADRLALLADMCRLNALTAIKRAGSGHIGTSFSSLDIITALYFAEMNTLSIGHAHPDRDVFLSSKGHDAPAIYAVLHAAGLLEEQRFLDLRRIGGVPGHPEIGTAAGIEANTGSLGMGISKARGIAMGKRLAQRQGKVFVLTGDGELQEGQNYEALQNSVAQGVTNICVFVDHNKVQSDRLVSETLSLGDLEEKFKSFGWHVARCDGNDPGALLDVFADFRKVSDRPKICICDTIKGSGVSFMEHPHSMSAHGGFYRFHSGAPSDADYEAAVAELLVRIREKAACLAIEPPQERSSMPAGSRPWGSPGATITSAYEKRLAELAVQHDKLVVLDADLAVDCGLISFSKAAPDRFIENGIAEQDMVSVAGGLALQGLLPVVNSFGCFLASRAQEQIFANNTERTKIIYVNHLAGLVPASPGFSHQSLRDIALFGALPQCVVVQPATPLETAALLDYLVATCEETGMMRIALGRIPETTQTFTDYQLVFGQGTVLREGDDAILFCYGPVMTAQATEASSLLRARGLGVRVVSTPWLNRVNLEWLERQVRGVEFVFVLEDHGIVGGLGDFLFSSLLEADLCSGKRLRKFGVDGLPACGTPHEVLRHHKLDSDSLAERIAEIVTQRSRGGNARVDVIDGELSK